MENNYKVTFSWDDEARVWIATSSDVRGLVLEHESFDSLIEEVLATVPELLDYKNESVGSVSLDFSAHRHELVACSG